MVNNYPEYAAGVNYKKTDTNGNRHFYSAQVVADPANETVESKLIKDGVVIDEGGSSVTVEALSVTENGTYSEEGKAYSPVVVNVPAPVSDFTTASVVITNNLTDDACEIKELVNISEEDGINSGNSVEHGQNKTISVLLYKDFPTYGFYTGDGLITVTGDIVYEDGDIYVSGAGTITCDVSIG